PLGLPALDVRVPRAEHVALGRAGVQLAENLSQKRARIGDDAEIRRIIAADLVRIDVDVDELAVGEIPGVAGQPRGGGAVVEARADGDDEVRTPARLVRRIGAVATDEAE